ncbi:MAG: hypothetical protein CL529_12050 [Aequorivita sp.]|nr:hypothetical protein [Aequorivita sp.]|tara:strand:+ start:1108 stop:2781 length:1674 start_codon:yes stop_codon:yes gene_type:complete
MTPEELIAKLQDYYYYSQNFQKINTKLDGLQNFRLREYQKNFFDFLLNIEGPKRAIVLKPRQAGFSTICASYFTHQMCTQENYKCIALADKKGRTAEIAGMYKTFIDTLPEELKPMIALKNTEQVLLNNPNELGPKGLGSSIKFETGQDPNAGRSGTRKGAHISEVAFIRYMNEIDEGVANSIPLHESTTIIKESTANGRAGIGKAFYDLWQASKRGDSIYKPFFVGWYEIDDYQIKPPSDFKATKYEKEILKRFPVITEANLMWRRLKLSEYLGDDEALILTPAERFKQDFPLDDEEAFLNTGAPVFDPEILNKLHNKLSSNRIADIKDRLNIDSFLLKNHWDKLKIFTPPRANMQYFIGADIAEGLASGDASTFCVIDHEFNQVASFYGRIDPDIFGHVLIEIGELYNNATLAPEKNNMGHTTVTTIKNEGYPSLYREVIEDKVTKETKERIGWVTSKSSKMVMLNNATKALREGMGRILDIKLVEEMGLVAREENGTVVLNSMDRTVAYCIAITVRLQTNLNIKVHKVKLSKETNDTRAHEALKPRKKSADIFG